MDEVIARVVLELLEILGISCVGEGVQHCDTASGLLHEKRYKFGADEARASSHEDSLLNAVVCVVCHKVLKIKEL